MKSGHNKSREPILQNPHELASGVSRATDQANRGHKSERSDRRVGQNGRRGARRAGRASSFAAHYGEAILTDGVAPIPRALYLYQGALNLSPQQIWFISYVLAHKWDGGLPHPRLQELARHARLGLRQIKNIKKSIVEAGLLEVLPRYGTEGGQDANSYDFGKLFARLESLIVADPALASRIPVDDLSETTGDADKGLPPGSAEDGAEPKDQSFLARYGRVILRCGIVALPRALFTYQADLSLSPQQMWFIGYILSFQWSTQLPYPSLRKMALNTGYSERQIHRIKDTLVEDGYLRVIQRKGADGGDTNSAYDFSLLLSTLNSLVRGQSTAPTQTRTKVEQESQMSQVGQSAPYQLTLEPIPSAEGRAVTQATGRDNGSEKEGREGGVTGVSGEVQSMSGRGEPHVSGRGNRMTEGGVNCTSEGRVNRASYEIESVQEEANQEEPHQQQPPIQIDEAQENAYYMLVDVGVIPNIAFDLAHHLAPDHILEWVRYYLSVLSKLENLHNPLGVLVSRLRSGEEPPYVPSSADLQSLRLQLSRYRMGA